MESDRPVHMGIVIGTCQVPILFYLQRMPTCLVSMSEVNVFSRTPQVEYPPTIADL